MGLNVRPYIRQFLDVILDQRLNPLAKWLADVWKAIWWERGQPEWLEITEREVATFGKTNKGTVHTMTVQLIQEGYIETKRTKGKRTLYRLTEKLTGVRQLDNAHII